jgi:hypothetical protein
MDARRLTIVSSEDAHAGSITVRASWPTVLRGIDVLLEGTELRAECRANAVKRNLQVALRKNLACLGTSAARVG